MWPWKKTFGVLFNSGNSKFKLNSAGLKPVIVNWVWVVALAFLLIHATIFLPDLAKPCQGEPATSTNFEFRYCLSIQFQRYQYFRFGQPHFYFRLWFVVEIIYEHCLWTCHSRNHQVCRWKKHICCFLPRDAMQARFMPSCGVNLCVCLSVCLSRSYILSNQTSVSETIRKLPLVKA